MKKSICEKCYNFKLFGKDCWYYWEGKKECSKFRKDEDDEEHFESLKEERKWRI